MKTFILLTFGFLGFAFYEMSGGADFEPASARMAKAEPAAPVTQQVAEAAVVATPAPEAPSAASITKVDDAPAVTRVSLNLTSVTTESEVVTPAPTAQIIDSADTPRIILPSLIATTDDANDVYFDTDIRSVSGNRVNVRGGPSTNFGVVGRLNRGEEVRILEDNGNGWVRMQPVDGGESGWMADFLLTSG